MHDYEKSEIERHWAVDVKHPTSNNGKESVSWDWDKVQKFSSKWAPWFNAES
jgi:hypothetical protein